MPQTEKKVPFPVARFLTGLLVMLLLTLNCSKKGTHPDTHDPPGTATVGVLLSGDADANAVGQTKGFIAAQPSVILNGETGLVANKVSAVISPSATVGQVNSLLDSMQARIICMDDASVFLTLSVPAANAAAEIGSMTSRLAQSEPFLFAFPCFIPTPPPPAEPDPEPVRRDIPGDPAAGNIAHLKACYMPAAWNAMSRANRVNRRVTVLVPDAYARLSPHAELPGQEFVAILGDGADVRYDAATNSALGNHGFYVSGILGAEYDDVGATGIHPGQANLIRIRSQNVGSDEWGVKLQQISDAIPSGSQTLVSTSIGYNDPTFSAVPKWQRLLLALKWRELVGAKQTQFLHLTSSGNAGRTDGEGALSVFNSPFTMAAQMVSPWDWLGAGEYSETDSLGYVQLQQLYGTTRPYIFQPLGNVLVVGSSRLNGARSGFSSVGADIRFVGERVFCPCVTNDATCIDGYGTPSGTSMAAPQAAGLAAYLMNLKANLTPMQAKQLLLDSYDNSVGVVNAYRAVLSLDDGLPNANVRKSILNVADTAAGTFDEKDLQAFLRVYDEPQHARDHSPYDLNGDGWTGGSTTAPFDLDINTPPAYTTVHPPLCSGTSFDESQVTDRDILYYYAYSSLYTGSASVRDSLLPCGSQVVATGTEYSADAWVWAERVTSWQPYRRDTVTDERNVRGETTGSEPVSAHSAVWVPCGSATVVALARSELTWHIASGNVITGLAASVGCEEADQTPSDSNCYAVSANSRADVSGAFEVRGGAVAFTVSASTSVGPWGSGRVYFGAGPERILELSSNESASISGELAPGRYETYIRGSGSATTASLTITLAPLQSTNLGQVPPRVGLNVRGR